MSTITELEASITELEGKIDNRREKMVNIFQQAGDGYDMSKVKLLDGDSTAKVEGINALNLELDFLSKDLGSKKRDLKLERELAEGSTLDTSGRALAAGAGRSLRSQELDAQQKSIGQLFIESEAYTKRPMGTMGVGPSVVLDTSGRDLQATLFQRSAGWSPESLRTGVVVPFATRPIQVTDLFPQAETSMAAVKYMEETTATNNAAERAEAAAYAESVFALTERTVTVQTIGHSLPVTDEQLADVAQARSYIDGRMGFFVAQRLDNQLINGDGSTPNIVGLLNASGLQTQAKGTDPGMDAIFKANQKVRVTGRAFPSATILHPDNWTTIRLNRTADGIYIWGNPSGSGPETLWGLQVVQSDVIASGTGLTGDFSPAMVQLYVRQGLEVQVGFVNDDFLKGKQTVRAGVRVANVVYRGAAYCSITSLV